MASLPNPTQWSQDPEEWPEELAHLNPDDPGRPKEPKRELSGEAAAEAGAEQKTLLNWLFIDLNSYFASVEQQVRPELRGRPVGVVPMMADNTCCIAASYEAKAFGVKTGTIVTDAKQMCPEIVLVEGRHELYTEYHHRIVAAVESCVPVTAVGSIDEMACRLIGRERPLLNALELGRRVKTTIREQVGEMLRSSVGLATNRFLAKVASDMEKPDGLVALPLDILPDALRQLKLQDLPGIGKRTEKRLNEKGIYTMDQLLKLDCEQANDTWGSVWGGRLHYWLRGEDFDLGETAHLKSIGHQHVLAPEMRTVEKAWAVAHKLLHKAAMRLRSHGLWASRIGLAIGFSVPRAEEPVSRFGIPSRGWHGELKLCECQDNQTLIAALRRLWDARPAGEPYNHPYFIGVHLMNLVPDRLHSMALFDCLEEEQGRTRLLATMDQINGKYGLSTVAPAAMLSAYKAAPTRIAFSSIPEIF